MEFKVIRSTCLLIILLIIKTHQTEAKKILCLLGVGTETSTKWNKVLLNELAARGHYLTVVTPLVWDLEHERNIDFIHLENTNKFLKQRYENKNNTENALEQSTWKLVVNWYDQHMATCRGNVESIGFSQVLNLALKGKRSFDMIIYDVTHGPSCLLHIAHVYDRIPIVGITSSTLASDILNINQNSVFNAALDPFVLSDFARNMNYWKRVYNTALYGFDYIYRQWILRPVIEGLWSHHAHAQNFNVPKSLNEIMPRFKVILANHHPALHTLTALPANIVPVPGLHIQNKTSPSFTADLLKFVESSKTGIVLIDLDLKQLGKSNVLAISEVVRNLSKYNFIWKVGESANVLENKPHNLFMANNFENQELLGLSIATNKINFVLTVPEILPIQECLYYGIPMISIALRPEQRYLAKRIEEQGFAINLQLRDIASTLAKVFEKTLTDTNLLNKAHKLQQSLRNQQNPSLDTAVWWVENLLQYPQANDHVISANKDTLGVFARNSFDIVLLFELLVLMCIINTILICRQTIQNFKKISKGKRKTTEKKEEKLKKLKKEKKEKSKKT